jgi:formylglycine-generating enzyme required for sulfatase activity
MVPIPAPPGGKAFWMSKTEVTWDAYDVFAFKLDMTEEQRAKGVDAASRPSNPYGAPDRGMGHQGYPAVSLTYKGADEFCRWLSAKTGKKYRLPTEAEWEHAARAGASSAGPIPSKELATVAWHWDNADDKTHPVGKLKPNAWGLHDMLGNAGEWCTGKDGKPVLRGGTFADKAADVHAGARALQTPDWNVTDPQNPKSKWWLSDGPFAGFRIIREN